MGRPDTRPRHWPGFAALPGVLLALLPKATCPLCVAAYAGVLSSLGLGVLLTDRVLTPVIVVSLIASVANVAWTTRPLRHRGPVVTSLIGALTVVVGRLVWSHVGVVIAGAALLVAASLWAVWLRRPVPLAAPIRFMHKGGTT